MPSSLRERYGEARELLAVALELCDHHRLGDVAITAGLELAALEVRTGDLLAATQRLNGALSITALPPPLLARREAQLGVIDGERERPATARQHLMTALDLFRRLEAWPEVRRCQLALAAIELDIGRGVSACRSLVDATPRVAIGELAGLESLLQARLAIADETRSRARSGSSVFRGTSGARSASRRVTIEQSIISTGANRPRQPASSTTEDASRTISG